MMKTIARDFLRERQGSLGTHLSPCDEVNNVLSVYHLFIVFPIEGVTIPDVYVSVPADAPVTLCNGIRVFTDNGTLLRLLAHIATESSGIASLTHYILVAKRVGLVGVML